MWLGMHTYVFVWCVMHYPTSMAGLTLSEMIFILFLVPVWLALRSGVNDCLFSDMLFPVVLSRGQSILSLHGQKHVRHIDIYPGMPLCMQ